MAPLKFRDLKPANIMRRHNGQLMLIDFGLACPFHDGQIDTVTLGTYGYAAPEQYPNQWGQGPTTLRSDIYSFGVVLHQLLSGEDPRKKPRKTVFTFSDLSKFSSDFAALVARMVQYKPEQRIGSIQEVKRHLEAIR
jgi:serine/threonine protein kinase